MRTSAMVRGRRSSESHLPYLIPPRTDRISDLPDELLHAILARLRSSDAATRTSILSRRWRRVWTHLPALSFLLDFSHPMTPAQEGDRVDAALHAHAAETTVNLLEISLARVTVDRVVPWLSFASQRLAGRLLLSLIDSSSLDKEEAPAIALPQLERATSITLILFRIKLLFNLPPTGGAFTAMATMIIKQAHMDSLELDRVLSTRCPNLKELTLEFVTVDGDLLIRSDSLEMLKITTDQRLAGKLKATVPKLLTLNACITCEAHIAAPMLSEVDWNGHYYDTSRHYITEAGRHLRRLSITTNSHTGALMRLFDTVGTLDITIFILKGREQYEFFLEDINQIPRCKVLLVKLFTTGHAFKTTLLHLLSKCGGVRKLVVDCLGYNQHDYPCTSPGCSCKWLERTHKVELDALEEVEVQGPGKADDKVELVRLLCNRNITYKKSMTITVLEDRKIEYIRKEILSMCLPNDNFEIIVKST